MTWLSVFHVIFAKVTREIISIRERIRFSTHRFTFWRPHSKYSWHEFPSGNAIVYIHKISFLLLMRWLTRFTVVIKESHELMFCSELPFQRWLWLCACRLYTGDNFFYKLEWCVDCSLYQCVSANLRISPSLLRTSKHKEPAVSSTRREDARDRGGLWRESDMALILDWVVCNFSELEWRSSIRWLSAELSSHYA